MKLKDLSRQTKPQTNLCGKESPFNPIRKVEDKTGDKSYSRKQERKVGLATLDSANNSSDKIFIQKDFRAFEIFCADLRSNFLFHAIEKHAKDKYEKFSKTTNLKLYPDGYKDFRISFKEIEKIFKEIEK